MLCDDLLAAERDDEDRPDIGMAARVSWARDISGPSCPHPARCGSAVPIGPIDAAIRSATTEEQITVGTTRT
jgi:hypothetical protein